MAKRVTIDERQKTARKTPPKPTILAGAPREGLVMISPRDLEPNPFQPRGYIDEEKLGELAASIVQDGIIEPLVARPGSNGKYQIIAGERRWRAAQIAKLSTLPVVINPCSDEEMEILALEENLHREDLNDVDRGKALRSLKTHLDLTWEQLGKRVGLSRRRVLMLAGLADLPEDIQTQIEQGKLTEKHSRAISQLKDPKQQKRFIEAIQREKISGDRAISAARLVQKDPEVSIEQAVKSVVRPAPKANTNVQGSRVQAAGRGLTEALAQIQPGKMSSTERNQLASELAALAQSIQEVVEQLKKPSS
jgi:ParB family chromosome partitioning protein